MKETFKQELQDLFSSSQVNQNIKLVTLNPVLENNIIKVGGHLKNVIDIPNNLKHQIILPRHHPVTDLLILHYHKSNHHYGRDQTVALVRERYWIVKPNSIIRKVLSTGLLCKHRCSMPKPQLVGNVPKERIAPCKLTFTMGGFDCFVPASIKQYEWTRISCNKQIKRYGVLFTCLSTRAVHLELSIDMTTDSFLMTLQRFIAQRSEPDIIWCGNESNFFGNEEELKKTQQNVKHDLIAKYWHYETKNGYLYQQSVPVWEKLGK